MMIRCPKCKRDLDPEVQMAKCGPAGHDPCVKVNIALPKAEVAKVKPKRPSFQSDFRFIWKEGLD